MKIQLDTPTTKVGNGFFCVEDSVKPCPQAAKLEQTYVFEAPKEIKSSSGRTLESLAKSLPPNSIPLC
jgi:hypothetical protein